MQVTLFFEVSGLSWKVTLSFFRHAITTCCQISQSKDGQQKCNHYMQSDFTANRSTAKNMRRKDKSSFPSVLD